MDISNFRAQFKGDGARANLFRVILNLPQPLLTAAGVTRNFGESFSIMCRSAAIPASMVGSAVVPYMGREIYLAGNRTFADWTVTVLNDEDYSIRKVFERWLSMINSHVENIRHPDFASSTSYTSDCIVEHLSKLGPENVIASYKMQNAFPIDVSEVQLDWATNDTIEEFNITFKYDNWDLADDSLA